MILYTTIHRGSIFNYFFDINIKSWTIYLVDEKGHQRGGADYEPNRRRLLEIYPYLTFQRVEVILNDSEALSPEDWYLLADRPENALKSII